MDRSWGVASACAGDGDGNNDLCVSPRSIIRAVSQWGSVIAAPLLLAGGKIYFGRRRIARGTNRPDWTRSVAVGQLAHRGAPVFAGLRVEHSLRPSDPIRLQGAFRSCRATNGGVLARGVVGLFSAECS